MVLCNVLRVRTANLFFVTLLEIDVTPSIRVFGGVVISATSIDVLALGEEAHSYVGRFTNTGKQPLISVLIG